MRIVKNMASALDAVLMLKQQGLSEAQIIDQLKQQGFKPKEILDALNQAKVKDAASQDMLEGMQPSILSQETKEQVPLPTPEPTQPQLPTVSTQQTQQVQAPQPQVQAEITPTPMQAQMQQPMFYEFEQATPTETIEAIAEQIISEKWEQFRQEVGDVAEIKKNFDDKIHIINTRLDRLEKSLDRLSLMFAERIKTQERTIEQFTKEVASIEQAFQKVLDPLFDNIRKLSEIVEALKKEQGKAKKK